MTERGLVPADVPAVWSHLVAWERQAAWMADADEVRVLGAAREGEGVRLAVRTRVLGLPALTEVLEVVAWEPPRLLRVRHTGFVGGAGAWTLEPAGRGSTRLTWTEDLTLPVPLAGEIALRAYAPFMRRLMRRSIAALAREMGA